MWPRPAPTLPGGYEERVQNRLIDNGPSSPRVWFGLRHGNRNWSSLPCRAAHSFLAPNLGAWPRGTVQDDARLDGLAKSIEHRLEQSRSHEPDSTSTIDRCTTARDECRPHARAQGRQGDVIGELACDFRSRCSKELGPGLGRAISPSRRSQDQLVEIKGTPLLGHDLREGHAPRIVQSVQPHGGAVDQLTRLASPRHQFSVALSLSTDLGDDTIAGAVHLILESPRLAGPSVFSDEEA